VWETQRGFTLKKITSYAAENATVCTSGRCIVVYIIDKAWIIFRGGKGSVPGIVADREQQ